MSEEASNYLSKLFTDEIMFLYYVCGILKPTTNGWYFCVKIDLCQVDKLLYEYRELCNKIDSMMKDFMRGKLYGE